MGRDKSLMTIGETAAALGVSKTRVRQLETAGALESQTSYPDWWRFYRRADVIALKAERGKRGKR